MKDKTTLLIDMIENPYKYGEEDIRNLLYDPETASIYGTLVHTAVILQEEPEINVEEEWSAFKIRIWPQHKIRFAINNFIRTKAAMILFVLFASFTMAATIIFVSDSAKKEIDSYEKSVTVDSEQAIDNEKASTASKKEASGHGTTEKNNVEVFKNVNLEEIMESLSNHYKARLVIKDARIGDVKLYFQWDKTLPLSEVIEQLNNFEQINIYLTDNYIVVE